SANTVSPSRGEPIPANANTAVATTTASLIGSAGRQPRMRRHHRWAGSGAVVVAMTGGDTGTGTGVGGRKRPGFGGLKRRRRRRSGDPWRGRAGGWDILTPHLYPGDVRPRISFALVFRQSCGT